MSEAVLESRMSDFRHTMLQAISASDLTWHQKRRLRLQVLFNPAKLESAVIGLLLEEGKIDETQAFGENFPWQDFFAFILEILPLILALFGL